MIHSATKEFLFLALSQNRFSEIFGVAQFTKRPAIPGSGRGGHTHIGIFSMAVAPRGSCFTRYWNQTLAPELLLEFYYFYTQAIFVPHFTSLLTQSNGIKQQFNTRLEVVCISNRKTA